MTRAEAGNALLLPGEQPPLTHLGATLLRHAVASGLRYAFHNLGLQPPEPAPICIEQLRLGLCPRRKIDLSAGDEVLAAVVAALEDPGGAGALPGRLRGALLFHRLRLRFAPRQPGRAEGATPRQELARHLPALRDTLLAELVAALDRRHRRAAGATVRPVQSPQAARWLAGRRADLARLGVADPYRPAWSTELPDGVRAGRLAGSSEPRRTGRPAASAPSASDAEPEAGLDPWLAVHSLRGRFRESWRAAASALHPLLCELGADACRRGVVGHPEDPFFLPFQLLDELRSERPPEWLPGAVLANRAEYFGILRGAEDETRAAWERSPLEPLP